MILLTLCHSSKMTLATNYLSGPRVVTKDGTLYREMEICAHLGSNSTGVKKEQPAGTKGTRQVAFLQ